MSIIEETRIVTLEADGETIRATVDIIGENIWLHAEMGNIYRVVGWFEQGADCEEWGRAKVPPRHEDVARHSVAPDHRR